MDEIRYFLGSSFVPFKEWDEVSEETYKAVRKNCEESHVFRSDSRADLMKETYFEGTAFLCGARVREGDSRWDMCPPRSRLESVADPLDSTTMISFGEQG